MEFIVIVLFLVFFLMVGMLSLLFFLALCLFSALIAPFIGMAVGVVNLFRMYITGLSESNY